MKSSKPVTPPHVRKTYQSICASKNYHKSNSLGSPNAPTSSLSHQIDTQRRLVLDLEREMHWLNSEKVSLRNQFADIDTSIATLSITAAKSRGTTSKISQVSDAINIICWNWIYQTHESKEKASLTLEKLCDIDSRIRFPKSETGGIVCACVVDLPLPDTPVLSHVSQLEKGINEIISYSCPFVRIVHTQRDSEENDAMRVFFSVSKESGGLLAREVDRLSNNPGKELSSCVKHFLQVTRSVIIDTQPSCNLTLAEDARSAHQSPPYQASISDSLNFPDPARETPLFPTFTSTAPTPAYNNNSPIPSPVISTMQPAMTPNKETPSRDTSTPEQISPALLPAKSTSSAFENFIAAKELPMDEVPEVSDEENSSSFSEEEKELRQRPARGSVRKVESPTNSGRSWKRRIARASVRVDGSRSPRHGSEMSTMSKTRAKWGKSAVNKLNIPSAIPEPE